MLKLYEICLSFFFPICFVKLYRMSDHATSMLSPENSQTTPIMENAIDVVIEKVNLNKENTSSTTLGVDGVENVEGSEEGGGDCAKKRKRTSQV